LQKEKRNSMMQVSSDRNTGEINHNSSHLDNLISFYKFVQVHLGRNIQEVSYSINFIGVLRICSLYYFPA
ncbi:MAG: hypothetical protein MSH65_10165, partial [Spirochaetia bacterium]|nr:hypothetical protein [Spirochaetia bacterium]